MKHILTAAALLAASAALASAATTTTFADLTASSTEDGVSYDSSTGTITATTTTDLFTQTGTTSSYAYYATNTISVATVKTSSDESTYAIGLGLANGYLTWTWGEAFYSNIVTLDSLSSSVDENGYLTVTIVLNSTDVSNSSKSAGSRLYLADGNSYYSAFGLAAGSATYTQITLDATYVAGITVTSGSVTDSSTIQTTSSTLAAATAAAAVPEPSAFGLLAGIGALALVAARRRRR